MVDEEISLKNEEEDGDNLIEDVEYSRKSEFSKATVVKEAISKIQETRSQEMKPGYWNIITLPNGSIKKSYFPDARKQYIGSVEYLKGLLGYEVNASSKGKDAIKKFTNDKKTIFDKYSVIAQFDPKEKYIPEVDEVFPIEVILKDKMGRSLRKIWTEKQGIYNWKVQRYWDNLVEIYDRLFDALNLMIAEKEFFKPKSSY